MHCAVRVHNEDAEMDFGSQHWRDASDHRLVVSIEGQEVVFTDCTNHK